MKFFHYFTREKIVPKNKNEMLLEEYMKDRHKVNWDKYLQRFESTYPLELNWTYFRPRNISCQEPLEYPKDLYGDRYHEVSNGFALKKFDHLPTINYGIYKKITPSLLMKQNFLNTIKPIVAHKRIIDILSLNCPDDFQAIPMKIINLHKKSEPYEVNDFYMINIIRSIRALDIKKSKIEWTCMAHVRLYRYKKDPWSDSVREKSVLRDNVPETPDGHIPNDKDFEIYPNAKPCMLAIDAIDGNILWHPKLAKQIPIDKSYFFATGPELR